jgi:osmotically-inducible protein OsmY
MNPQPAYDQHDSALETRIIETLERQNFPALRSIKVQVHHGMVTLRGKVNSFYERQLCIHACKRLPGVRSMKDRLQVS